MNLNLTSQVEMTGFIVDEGCLYAVLKVADGDTQLYDKQALAWIISQARKEGTKVPNYEKALQILTTVNIWLAKPYRCFSTEKNNPNGNTLPVMGGGVLLYSFRRYIMKLDITRYSSVRLSQDDEQYKKKTDGLERGWILV